jgi:Tol biopolymer transport system component
MSAVRSLLPHQSCRVRILDIVTNTVVTVHESSTRLYEAPNWSTDDSLVLNGDGLLWTVDARGGEPQAVELRGVPELNNDHVLGRDGIHVYVSANDWQIYEGSLADGSTRLLTTHAGAHFLHGISPDGSTLAYIAIHTDDDGARTGSHIRTMRTDGSDDRLVTSVQGSDDGSEFARDGDWIYFNTDRFSPEPGHAQIARVRPDGTGMEQLTFDDRVNWFPHASSLPGRYVYLSYPSGTEGHPADLPVELKLVEDDDWENASTVVSTSGGQGTINVNSWSPDGTRFAYVDYPFAGA